MTKQEQIAELAYWLSLSYFFGLSDGMNGSKCRIKMAKQLEYAANKNWEKWVPFATDAIQCIIPQKHQPNKRKPKIVNSILSQLEIK